MMRCNNCGTEIEGLDQPVGLFPVEEIGCCPNCLPYEKRKTIRTVGLCVMCITVAGMVAWLLTRI
jgi:hypothetical protein